MEFHSTSHKLPSLKKNMFNLSKPPKLGFMSLHLCENIQIFHDPQLWRKLDAIYRNSIFKYRKNVWLNIDNEIILNPLDLKHRSSSFFKSFTLKRNWLFYVILLFVFHLHGQEQISLEPTFNFSHLNVDDGLSQGTVLSIFQDKYGFIWLGTRDGLNRYNAYDFKVFRHELGNNNSISGNIIYDIDEDNDNQLWVVTQNGLSVYNREKRSYSNFDFYNGKKITTIRTLLIDKKNRIWVGGTFGLLGFDRENNRFFRPQSLDNYPYNFSANIIKEDPHGTLWIGANDFGLLNFNPDTNEWKKIEIVHKKSIDSRIETLVVEEGHGIWLGTYGDGLFHIDVNGKVLKHYHDQAQSQFKISNNYIRSLAWDNDNQLWIGTFNGLNILDVSGKVTELHYDEGKPQGLNHGSIRALYKDVKGSIWVGTYFGGANIYDRDNQRFNHYYHISGQPTSLSYNVIGAFAEDSRNNIYIGTERGGLNRFDRDDQNHYQILDGQYSTIKSLFKDSENRLWVGVFKGGLNEYDPKTNQLISYPKNQPNYNFLSNAIVNDIKEDAQEHLWIATDSKGGIHKFDLKKDEFIDFPYRDEISEILKYTVVKSISGSQSGEIILATKGKGIIYFNINTGQIKTLNTFPINGSMENIDEFNHVYRDQNNNLWLSSNGEGLIKFNQATNNYEHFDVMDGLSNNIVQGVLEDQDGYIWAVTLSGLSKLNKRSDALLSNYNKSSGLPLNEINEGAFYKTRDDKFLIGGDNGYVSFNPTELKQNQYVPQMVFTGIEVMNKQVFPHDGTGVLDSSLNESKHIILKHSQSVLSLGFSALSYLKPENNHYQYKLEGFDKNWIYAHKRQQVTYTNLESGKYTFLVKGSNNDAVWNETPLSLRISVLPAPWKTWWAYLIYTGIILSVLYFLRLNDIRRARLKHRLRIENLEKEKWKEIHDLKLKYFIDVSHEFRTPLTLISAPLEEILDKEKSPAGIKKLAKQMHVNVKRLQLLIDQILELRALETGNSKLELQPIDIMDHIKKTVGSFNALADQKNIDLSVNFNSKKRQVVFTDSEKLDKIFFNLIYNAFKFTPNGGEIKLDVISKPATDKISYEFIFSDNGIGIDPEFLPKIFERFQKNDQDGSGTGIGLALTKSLIDAFKGSIEVASVVDQGTTFRVFLTFDITSKLPVEPSNYKLPVPIDYQNIKEQPTEEDTNQKNSILVVEDNRELREYLVEKLRKDYKVYEATNGEEGMQKTDKIGPDIVISDVMMPKMSGLELCNHIKTSKELCHIPVILLTAKTSQQNRMEGYHTGADAYVEKPFNLAELKLRISTILKNQKIIQEKYKKLSSPLLKDEKLLNPQDEKLMAAIIDAIGNNLDKPNFTVEELGEMIGLSRVHLFRKLKSITGESPSGFIRDVRMKNACELLKTQNYRTSEIAYMVGFQDAKYFGKCFKKYSGLTPSAYMKKNKE